MPRSEKAVLTFCTTLDFLFGLAIAVAHKLPRMMPGHSLNAGSYEQSLTAFKKLLVVLYFFPDHQVTNHDYSRCPFHQDDCCHYSNCRSDYLLLLPLRVSLLCRNSCRATRINLWPEYRALLSKRDLSKSSMALAGKAGD